jgi:NAD(P)-dependent dehydrogenase (short-subunit alcohol dehydrogenase family)
MGRAGRSGELDTTVIYLASDASTFITGQIITVDGGWIAL